MITYKNLKLKLITETKYMNAYEVYDNDVILGICEVYLKSKFLKLSFQLNTNTINMDEGHLKSIVTDLTDYFNKNGINKS